MKTTNPFSALNRKIISIVTFYILAGIITASARPPQIHYTVSMDKPASHVFNVTMTYDGVKDAFTDLKMAVWTPGYYWLTDYSQNVSNFSVRDEKGNTLSWEKTCKNIWHVNTEGKKSLTLTYEVYADNHSVAEPYIDDTHAFIAPAGLFIYPAGELKNASEVSFKISAGWKTISTGLKPVNGKLPTYRADNYDQLFDCPVLLGNQEVISFDVDGVPHHIAWLIPETIDRENLINTYKKVIETAVNIFGEMPYEDYTFIIMGPGGGGLEHTSSMAVFTGFRGSSILPPERDKLQEWMSFIAHEYFHLYNVKTIRPIALGPFDYDRENYTNMLWVSEGFTVYYENIILNRAGLMNRGEMLNTLKNTIMTYESVPGHKVMSATQSSFDQWIHSYMRGPDAINTSISYYDKGCALGLLLDLKIRNETKNTKCLDDVMRYLYYKFYKDLGRGFTDDEFREVCEKIAGCDLREIFNYASTTGDIDYSKYFSYAGLTIEDRYKEFPGSYTGIRCHDSDKGTVIDVVESGSPAWETGLASSDIIISVGDQEVTSAELDTLMSATAPGSSIEYKILRRGEEKSFSVVTKPNMKRSFNIGYISNPTQLQTDILNSLFRLVDNR
jgi:predicted metalloprotease with PDZ domain